MQCCTYLSERECVEPVNNVHLRGLLSQVIEVTGREWRLQEIRFNTGILWWRKSRRQYVLYLGIPHGEYAPCREFLVINFYREEGSTIPFPATSELISAYFYGILGAKSL